MRVAAAAALWLLLPAGASAAEVVVAAAKVAALPLGPADPAWDAAPAAAVPLMAQILVSPRGGSTGLVEVRALRTADRIAFRLSWPDSTRDDTWDISNRFADACAVQVPARAGEIPRPQMGHAAGYVSILRWRSLDPNAEPYPKAHFDYHRPDALETTNPSLGAKAEHLTSQGFGTLGRKTVQDAVTAGEHRDGRWTVTLAAPLKSFLPAPPPPGATAKPDPALPKGLVPVAFAVWDGARAERDGLKSISVWHWLSLDGATEAAAPAEPQARGARVFARYGCETCHGPGGKGGVANPNTKGNLVPPINRVAEGFTDEELVEVITKGRVSVPEDDAAPPPPLRMNAWGTVMGTAEMTDLIAYLKSLMPKPKPGEDW